MLHIWRSCAPLIAARTTAYAVLVPLTALLARFRTMRRKCHHRYVRLRSQGATQMSPMR